MPALSHPHDPGAREQADGLTHGLPMRLRPGQRRAVDRLRAAIASYASAAGRETADARVQYHAATGSGKTLVSRVLAEELSARSMAFGAPRIDLLGQAFEDYRRVTARHIDAVVVCSAPEIRDARGFPPGTLVTTSTQALRERLALPVPAHALRVVFFTYQSSRKLMRAVAAEQPLDLLVLDEAHRVASSESAFSLVWDSAALPARVRLALTATPTPEMGSTGVYGTIADRYTVAEGIRDGVLCDYRVQVLGVSDRGVATLLHAEPDRRSVAVADALLTEIAAGHMKRVLTFHRRRLDAHRFVRIARQVSAVRGVSVPTLLAQSGADSPAARVTALRRLEAGGGLIASPRIYLEGTDVRAIDTVTFVDPKSSPIDISQGIGRALRVNPADPGKVAQIVIPVAVTPEEAVGSALEESEFKRVWDVLRVLAAQDERLAQTLEAARPAASRRRLSFLDTVAPAERDALLGSGWTVRPTELSATSPEGTEASSPAPLGQASGPGADGAEAGAEEGLLGGRLSLHGLERDLAVQVTLRAAEEVGDQRARDIALLAAYVERAGTTLMPAGLTLPDGYALGSRVQRLRQAYHAGHLPPDLVAKLERIPQWREETGPRSAVAELWPRLVAYEAHHGHAAIPVAAVGEDGFPLGERVEEIRAAYRAGTLASGAVAQCQALAGWTWDVATPTPYLRALPLLREFVRLFGHARVPSPGEWPRAEAGRDAVVAAAELRLAYAAGQLHSGDVRALEREFNFPWTAPPLTPPLRRKINTVYPQPSSRRGRGAEAWAAADAPPTRRRMRWADDDLPPPPRVRLGD